MLTKEHIHTLLPMLLIGMLFLWGSTPVSAQHQQHHPQPSAEQVPADTSRGMGMMQGGMMQGDMMSMHMQMMEQMMGDPLARSAMLVRVLPDLQEPLGLSDAQVTTLSGEREAFTETWKARSEQRVGQQQQLDDLLASDQPDPAQVASHLKDIAVLQAESQAIAYEAATSMIAALSAEQRDRLDAMTPMQWHHQMMTSMTMMEMMQTMHGGMMAGMDCPMMSGGMMQEGMPGMMQGGTMHR